MSQPPFTTGLHDIGNGLYAYLQPNGSWGYSNAGLIADGGQTLLVDTLFDLPLTRAMLARMREAVPAAARIGVLVNTHANPDHTHGNQLVPEAQIVASKACLEEMKLLKPPSDPASLPRRWRELGAGGAFFQEVMFRHFDYDGIVATLPTRTFEGELSLTVGNKTVRLIEVGPAHTRGDIVVYVPSDRAVFAGDIAFVGGHPIVWAGPIGNWIKACDRILGWDVETIVPGHGPVTDKQGIREIKDYFEYVHRESRKRYDSGMSFEEAARDIALGHVAGWLDPERIVVNVYTCYREFRGETSPPDFLGALGAMGSFYFEHKTRRNMAVMHSR